MKKNLRICMIILLIILGFSCQKNVNKENNQEVSAVNNDVKNYPVEETNSNTKLPDFMYVNSKDGLRLRDKPDVSGNVIDVLKYKQMVIIKGKSNEKVIIDNIEDYWYMVTVNDLTGWVFAGYLRNTVDEIDCEEITGLYYADEYKLIEESLTHFYGYESLIDFNNFKKEMFFEITYLRENLFRIDYHFPFYRSADPKRDNQEFEYPPTSLLKEDNPFLYFMAGSGAGTTEIYFYYREEQILMEFKREEHIDHKFKCEIKFKKKY